LSSTAVNRQPMMLDRPLLTSTLVTTASGQSFATSLIPTATGNSTKIIDINTAGTDNSISGAYIDEIWFQFSQLSNNYFAPTAAVTGTYSATSTSVTVTYANHNVQVGQQIYLDFTSYSSGSVPADDTLSVTAVTANTFTCTIPSLAGTITGNVNIYLPTDFCFYLVNTSSITSISQFLPLFTVSVPSVSASQNYSLTLNSILPLINQPVTHSGANFSSANSTVAPKMRGLLIGNGSALYVSVGGSTALTNGFYVNMQGGYY